MALIIPTEAIGGIPQPLQLIAALNASGNFHIALADDSDKKSMPEFIAVNIRPRAFAKIRA